MKIINERSNFIYNFHIITHEQLDYIIDFETQKILNLEFKKYNVQHYPIKWEASSIKKIRNLLNGFELVKNIKKNHNPIAVITLGSVAASFAYLYSKVISLNIIAHTFEPHSKFLLETGFWNKTSLGYLFLNYLEKKVVKNAYCIMTGTNHYKKVILDLNPNANVIVVPSNVDETQFQINSTLRNDIRKKLNIEQQTVFVYLGKFGGIYYNEEIIEFFSIIKNNIENAFFLVLTPNSKDSIELLFQKYKIEKEYYHINKIPYSEVPQYLNASDIGIIAIPPTPSQKFRSPIKVGEYLLCGLPYVICRGISEDDDCATINKVGVVLENFNVTSIEEKLIDIKKLLEQDIPNLQERCRVTGINYREIGRAHV